MAKPTQPWRDALMAYFRTALRAGVIGVGEDNRVWQVHEVEGLSVNALIRRALRVLIERTHGLARRAVQLDVDELAVVQFEQQLREVASAHEWHWVDHAAAEAVATRIDVREETEQVDAPAEQADAPSEHEQRLKLVKGNQFVRDVLELLEDGRARKRADLLDPSDLPLARRQSWLGKLNSESECGRDLRAARALGLIEQPGGEKSAYVITDIGQQILAELRSE